jgi:hypothetical protein
MVIHVNISCDPAFGIFLNGKYGDILLIIDGESLVPMEELNLPGTISIS